MVTSALLLAGGVASRWEGHLGLPKHLAPVPVEPNVHRLQRELLERGVDDVMVACKPEDADRYVSVGRAVELADLGEGWRHEWEDSRQHWPDHRLLIIYGDCYLTPRLLDRMVADEEPGWRVYARWGSSTVTGKHYGEMFGWVIQPDAHDELDAAAAYSADAYRSGRHDRCLGWEVYRTAVGYGLGDHRREDVHGIEWNDLSEDFDWPHDYDRWLAAYRAAGSVD
ncbi:MAG TPA: NTP transferase domain-containing protein [Acidimicrobiia bacterium]